ncbi:MAG TPA: pepsin/retropepsin-like aspartic protease family protein [Chthoniobacterales bacterium]
MITRGTGSLLRCGWAALLIFALASPAFAAPRRQTTDANARRFGARAAIVPQPLQFQSLALERSAQNHLLVRAIINGKPALLGVDTGAPISAVAINRVQHFGLAAVGENSEIPRRLQINGAYNSVAIARTLQLGALTLIDEPLVAIDLGSSSKAAKLMREQAIDGILGADVLFPTDAVLDCQAQTLTMKIDPHARGPMPGMNYRGFSSVPIHVSPGYNLYVDGTFNGRRAKLMVDTGAFATLLHHRFVRRMKIPMRDSPFRSAGVNLKQRGVQLATISSFSVGSVNMKSKEVGVINLEGLVRSPLLNASTPVAGLLGSEILRRHNGIIDFGTRTLYLKH